MRLYIAEKPSLGRALASVLPHPQRKQNGFIQTGDDTCVTWCIGHLLELAEPEDYDASLKTWRLDALPFIPKQFRFKAKSQTAKQLAVVKKLIKSAKEIVHVGDPDREGQLLVDEVLWEAKLNTAQLAQVKRLLINDLNPQAIKRALEQVRPNSDFYALSQSAIARTHADWLYGLNMTRTYSLLGQQRGARGVLSVGRVQTPVLGLVVRRDAEIAAFTPHDYYEVAAEVEFIIKNAPHYIKAKWLPSEACAEFCDSEGRVLSKPLCEHVIKRITGKPALVDEFTTQRKTQNAPLPYSLSSLQIDAAKQLKLSAQTVLDLCQSLYENHQLITYPRSDSRYLPEDHWQEASTILTAIKHNASQLGTAVQQADCALRSKCWNDKKVDAHHAIIPTAKHTNAEALSRHEQAIYQLICRHYLAQFYPAWITDQQTLMLRIDTGLFKANGATVLQWGWKFLWSKNTDDDTSEQALPKLKAGDAGQCLRGLLLEKATQPPEHFTDASLLAAMTGIARFVTDPLLKPILKETDGIGTEATRAGIIELLFRREYLTRDKKYIVATNKGKALIIALPPSASTPDMTAHWERKLSAIAQGELNYADLIAPLSLELKRLIENAKPVDMPAAENLSANQSQLSAKPKRKGIVFTKKNNNAKKIPVKNSKATTKKT
ncbi:MAG TPA: DNA topoisomerase III [Cellvibrionaceae bacterium]